MHILRLLALVMTKSQDDKDDNFSGYEGDQVLWTEPDRVRINLPKPANR